MLRLLTLYFIVQTQITVFVKSDCGCNVDRSSTEKQEGNLGEGECSASEQKSRWLRTNTNDYDDMILVPSGKYQLGTNDIAIESDREGPKRIVEIKKFYLDKYEVPNAKFNEFLVTTGYKTEAENFGDSFVFTAFLNDTVKDALKDFRVVKAEWWYKVTGADWQHPYGADSDIKDTMDHPVVHVSWRDAKAYCAWRKARLPTEAEWEAACRGGHNDTTYPWGNKLYPDKKHMANIWQGTFPKYNSEKDGYLGTNPVDSFPIQNDLGFYNMAGNVWEWTEDPWTTESPSEKVKKGGSFLCHRSYCYRYRCSSRSHNTEDSTALNLGFRCAKSA